MINILLPKQRLFVLTAMGLFALVLFVLTPKAVSADSAGFNITNINVDNTGSGTILISWNTDADTSGRVIYGTKENNLNDFIGDSSSPGTYHKAELDNLKSQTDYYYQIIAYNDTEQVSSFVLKFSTKNFKNVHAVLISDLEIPYISGTAAFITWTTDYPSNSVVQYDNKGTYRSGASGNGNTMEHQVILRGLKPNTEYWVRAYSVDKDNNKSSYILSSFFTAANNNIDSQDLIVNYLRPSSPTDSYLTSNSMEISFKTNHYAKGTIRVSASGWQTKTYNLDWNSSQDIKVTGLAANKQYKVDINLNDIFNKSTSISFTITTKSANAAVSNGTVSGNSIQLASYVGSTILTTGSLKCNGNVFSTPGYYGQYFTARTDTQSANDRTINDFEWDSANFVLARIDGSLNFGSKFYALGMDADNQSNHFFAYWRALIDVPTDGNYSYTLASDDESWVYIDGILSGKLGSNDGSLGKKTIDLTKGPHAVEVYFVYRGHTGSTMSFQLDQRIAAYPWPNSCSLLDLYKLKGSSVGSGQISVTAITSSNNAVRVAGAEYSYYSQATVLYKTKEAPDIYAIINGQKHFISSPAAFNDYGYDWSRVKTISAAELAKYPEARLVKLPDQSTVYFLYQRPQNKWLKIALDSPTVFVSYQGNYWGNIITIDKFDLDSYPDVKLIKTATDSSVYYLENNVRHFVSADVFTKKGFNPAEVVTVSQVHLESYKLGNPLSVN